MWDDGDVTARAGFRCRRALAGAMLGARLARAKLDYREIAR